MTMVIKRRHPDNRGLPREEVRGRIYAAAIAIFRKKGFAAATVEEIASAAKVAKGTVFNFFPAKGAILLGYYEEIDAKFGAAMAKMSSAEPKAALAAFYGEAEALLRAEGSLVDDIFRELAADATLRKTDDVSGDRDRGTLVAFFRVCKERGTLSAEVEPAVAGHIVSDLWSATVQDWLRFGKRYSLRLRLATKLEALFKGLAPAAHSLVAALLFAFAAVVIQPLHAAEVSQTGIAAMQGLYEDAQGDVAIAPFSEFGDASFFIDYTSGRVGPLQPERNGFAIGIGMKNPHGETGIVVRTRAGLHVRIDGTGRTLHAVSLDREPFVVTSGHVKLAGELVRRADRAPKGAVVIVHGSNDSPRSAYGPWVFYLVSRGWAVAVYDKRGSGRSTGDWREGGFAELASDVRAVTAFVRNRPLLSDKPVGMLGISQAGWIMPLAAENGGFDFVVSLAGAGVTPAEQTLELTEAQLKAYSLPPDEIAKALAYYRLDLDVSMGRRPWLDIDAAYKRAKEQGARWLLAPPEPVKSPSRAFLGRIAAFDPAPHWAKVHIPVLAVFGGKDLVVPAEPNRALVAKMLSENGSPATKAVVIAGINHVGMIARTGTIAEYPALDRYDPAYFQTFGDWLDEIAAR